MQWLSILDFLRLMQKRLQIDRAARMRRDCPAKGHAGMSNTQAQPSTLHEKKRRALPHRRFE
jgi:hypothetical protein